MPTRRDFLHASGAAALALATPEGEAQAGPEWSAEVANRAEWASEPTYLGRPARYWLGRLLDRNTVEYSRFAEQNDSQREETYSAVAAFGERIVPELRRIMLRGRESGRRYGVPG